ncbi:MAG: amidohydrolase family protein, partial [Chloroflexota bacterium]
TMDGARPTASAFAIEGNLISELGEAAAPRAPRTRDTEIVDLGGRTVVPGFIDAHSRFGPLSLAPHEVDLRDGTIRRVRDILDRVGAAAWAQPAGTWIRALGYNDDVEGSITPGKLANFVVLEQDPRAVAPDAIRDIIVAETWVDGQRAYRHAAGPLSGV